MNIKKIIIANWKMNGSLEDSIKLIHTMKNINPDKQIIICPPFTLIYPLRDVAGKNIIFGAQNCSEYTSGAFTGEVSAKILADIGCQYVIVGHSERKRYYNETNSQIRKKISQVMDAGLKAILCIGETLNDRESNSYLFEIKKQIDESIPENINTENLIIAYEPLWAIGSGLFANSLQIEEINNFISQIFKNNINIIYGGSVSPANIDEILGIKLNSGVLVGGASLDIDAWQKIIN